MPARSTVWRPWTRSSALQPIPVSAGSSAGNSDTVLYMKSMDSKASSSSYQLHRMPSASKHEAPLGRKLMMLGLFFVFWLVTSAFFMNLYIARYLS